MQCDVLPPIDASPRRPASPRGFTLAELLVVITIIVIASLISIPSLVYLFKNTATSQAVVQMQAALAEARGLAITTHAPAAAIFYEDPGYGAESAVFYATAAPGQGDPGTSPLVTNQPYIFIADPTVQPGFFPKGIYVAGYVGPFAMDMSPQPPAATAGSSVGSTYTGQMDGSGGTNSTGYLIPNPQSLAQLTPGNAPTAINYASSSDPLRAVVFMPDGRSVICPYFAVENVPQDAATTTPPPAGALYYGLGPSCVGLSVYDASQLTAADKASQGALGAYLVPNPNGTPHFATSVPLYIVNTYNGSLIGGTP
jgi:prepilin-type N-terminal cleavage/methylation domain-containing protein